MKILILFNLKTVYKIKDMIFPMFDDVFTVKILGMWKKRGFTPPPPCRGAPPLLSQYHNGLFHKKNKPSGR